MLASAVQRPADSSYIPTLDGWRAVAIMGVLLCHAFDRDSIFDMGELGVMLFFAISGFLITNRMLSECDRTGRLSLKNFYIRRVLRIQPSALFYLAVVYTLGRLSLIPCTGAEVLACMGFFRNYATWATGWYTAHFWSLSVEEHFYLVWPTIFVLTGRTRAKWVAPALAVLAIFWRVVDGHFDFVARIAHDPLLAANPYRSDYCADGLFWGCTLALWLPMVRRVPWAVGTLLAVAIGGVVLGTRYLGVPHNYAITGLCMSALLGCTVLRPQSWLGRALELGPVRFVGRISYSLYLWQMLFLTWNEKLAWQHLPLNVVFASACAVFSYYVIERPLIRIGHRLAHTNYPQQARLSAAPALEG
jgi:peptidoglycan/LPS O-acetylase OafA/YrhL